MPWFREPFFDPRPAIAYPALNGLIVAFARSSFGTLATPSQLPEDFPDMPGMVRHPELAPNDLSNSFQGPEVRLVTLGRGSGQQDGFQAAQIAPRESRFAARPPCAGQCGLASRFPQVVPATGGLTADTQLPSHGSLRNAAPEQLRGADTPLLFGQVVAQSPTQGRNPFHGG